MIRGVKFRKLLEQCQSAQDNAVPITEQLTGRRVMVDKKTGKPIKSYEQTIREQLGIKRDVHGNLYVDNNSRSLDAREVDFAEMTRSFLGNNLTQTDIFEAFGTRLQETGGGFAVTPSTFANISGFRATAFGLLDALAGEINPEVELIGDQLVPTTSTNINGGKRIGARGNDKAPAPLNEGEAAPVVGLNETYWEMPEQYRYSQAVKLTSGVFIYDRTGQIQQAVDLAGTAVKFAKELDIAKAVMGITNTYSELGKTANTYQDVATDYPNNYVNTSIQALTSWTDINDAMSVMRRNRDPFTGRPIALQKPFTIIVSPDNELTLNTILRATMVRIQQDSVDQRYGPNPLMQSPEVANFTIKSSQFWWDALEAASGTEDATDNWYMGNIDRAFAYRTRTPFSGVDDPSEVSPRHDVVMCRVYSLWGRPDVVNPRRVYRGTPN